MGEYSKKPEENRMNDDIIRAYAQRIQGFAWQKTHHLQDAEDLSQEILLVLCRMDFASRQIEHMDAFIWRICTHTWSNFVRRRMRDKAFYTSSEEMELIPSQEDIATEVADRLLRDETYARLYREIAYLGRTRREVIRRHYFGGETSREIGRALGLSDATVRWYLGDTQKRLKERMNMKETEKIYEPKRLEVFFSGRSATDHLYGLRGDLLVQNICFVCADRRGLNIEEMAAKLCMSAAFIEDKLEDLVHMAFLEPVGNSGRYRTTFYIRDAAFITARAAWLSEHLGPVARCLYEEVRARLDRIRAIGFTGCDLEENFLMWWLVSTAAHIFDAALPDDVPEVPSIPRGDGSRFRLQVSRTYEDVLREARPSKEIADCIRYFGGAAGKGNRNGRMAVMQWDPPLCVPNRCMDMMRVGYLERVYRIIREGLPLSEPDRDMVAALCADGYARVENGRPVLCIPYLTKVEDETLGAILHGEIVPAVMAEYGDLGRAYAAYVATLLPRELDEDERHFVMGHFYNPNAYTYLLCRDGLLKKPSDEQCRAICTVAWSLE